jgi:site-specific recombinase XerD
MLDERDVWRQRWTLASRSAQTRDVYERGIADWFAFCDRNGVAVFAAEQHHVDAYRHELADAGRQPATIARHLSTVSSFYRYVLRHGRPSPVERNPAEWVERPRVDRTSRRAGLDLTEARMLRAASLTRDARTAALVHLLLGTAMRVSEAVTATVDGLGWSDNGDRTLAVVRKGGQPDMVVIEPADWQVIDRYLTGRPEVPAGWLFATTGGRRMTRQTAYRIVREVADPITGPGRKVGAHSLRHTAATLALDAGQPIQEVQGMLRHASAETTQRYDRAWRERGRGATRALAQVWGES